MRRKPSMATPATNPRVCVECHARPGHHVGGSLCGPCFSGCLVLISACAVLFGAWWGVLS